MRFIIQGVLTVLSYIGITSLLAHINEKVRPQVAVRTANEELIKLLNVKRSCNIYASMRIPQEETVVILGCDVKGAYPFKQGDTGKVTRGWVDGEISVTQGSDSYKYNRDNLLWVGDPHSRKYCVDPTFLKKEEALIHALVMPYTSTLRTLVNDKDTLPEHKYTEVLREIRKEIQEAVYAFGELEKTLQEELEDKLEKSALERLEEAYHEDRKISVASTTKDNLERMLKNLKGDDNNA
ncbi:hypothetical protein [Brochothrix phage BtpYZU04]